MTQTKTRALTEGALMVAAATALSYVKLLELPQGGSVCIGMLPIFVYIGTVVGCLCRFLVHFISGITIYRIYEPTELFNTTFANPYIYSAAYNGSYMVIDMVLCLVITALLYRPLSRYFAPQETVAAVKRNQGPEL